MPDPFSMLIGGATQIAGGLIQKSSQEKAIGAQFLPLWANALQKFQDSRDRVVYCAEQIAEMNQLVTIHRNLEIQYATFVEPLIAEAKILYGNYEVIKVNVALNAQQNIVKDQFLRHLDMIMAELKADIDQAEQFVEEVRTDMNDSIWRGE